MKQHFCDYINELSVSGRWEDVFSCLNIDQEATVELSDLTVPLFNDSVIDKTTMNTLDVILSFMLFTNQILFMALMIYCALFSLYFLRLVLPRLFYKFQRTLKAKLYHIRACN